MTVLRAISSRAGSAFWRDCGLAMLVCGGSWLVLPCGSVFAQVSTEAAGSAEAGSASQPAAQELATEVAAAEAVFTEAFNRGDVDAVVAAFVADGEIVDDSGTLYRGHEELRQLFSGYFEQFPDAQLVLAIDSIRTIGGQLAIEEGSRLLTTADQQAAQVRYIATLTKADGRWLLASLREFYDEPPPSPSDYLAGLEWLLGDWISESDGWTMRVSYRWADGGQFIIGDLHATRAGELVLDTQQRIGWDPRAGKVRSWLFDSDGGLGGGLWTADDEGWLIRSESVDPLGVVGTATVAYRPIDANRYLIIATDRVVGDERLDDFEVTVTRAPPAPASAGAEAKAAAGNEAATGGAPSQGQGTEAGSATSNLVH